MTGGLSGGDGSGGASMTIGGSIGGHVSGGGSMTIGGLLPKSGGSVSGGGSMVMGGSIIQSGGSITGGSWSRIGFQSIGSHREIGSTNRYGSMGKVNSGSDSTSGLSIGERIIPSGPCRVPIVARIGADSAIPSGETDRRQRDSRGSAPSFRSCGRLFFTMASILTEFAKLSRLRSVLMRARPTRPLSSKAECGGFCHAKDRTDAFQGDSFGSSLFSVRAMIAPAGRPHCKKTGHERST